MRRSFVRPSLKRLARTVRRAGVKAETVRELVSIPQQYVLKLPTTYWIDISSRCNLKCVMCPQHNGLDRRTGFMPFEVFKKLVDQIHISSPLLKLYMSGEPLLHKNVFEMIEYAAAKDCRTMIHTNATLLSEAMAEKLVRSSLDFLYFSFDGCNPRVYESLRLGANFYRVKTNIESFLKMRDQLQRQSPYTSVEIIRLKETASQINSFVAYWEKKGIDKVSVREGMNWLGTVDERRVHMPRHYGLKPCSSPFRHCAILSDGTVVPCCLDVHGRLPLGNIAEQKFLDIWNGEKYFDLRIKLFERNIPRDSICYECENIFITSRHQKRAWLVLELARWIKYKKQEVMQRCNST